MSDQPANDHAAPRRGPVWIVLRRRAMELVIVFAGVYAAFWLNRMDTERHDAKRRAQIVGALEREISENAADLKDDVDQGSAQLAKFERLLAAGGMPRLSISYMNSGFSDTDDATLLQAGGLDLLDMQTIELMRRVNTLQRQLAAATHNRFEVSLAEFANRRADDFYDASTRQLKPQYQWYPLVLHGLLDNARKLLAAEQALLTHLRSAQANGTQRPV